MDISIKYKIGPVIHNQSVPYTLDIQAGLKYIVVGAIIGSMFGILAKEINLLTEGKWASRCKPSPFQPFGNKFLAGVDVNLPRRLVAGIGKFMRRAGGNDDDLSGMSLKGASPYRKGRRAFLDDENFLVRMLVQLHSAAWHHIDPDERDLRVLIQSSLKFVSVPVERQGMSINNRVMCLPYHIFLHPTLSAWNILRNCRLYSQE